MQNVVSDLTSPFYFLFVAFNLVDFGVLLLQFLFVQTGKDTILEIPWFAPDSAPYAVYTDEPWHFCLLARVVAPHSDPMIYPEVFEDLDKFRLKFLGKKGILTVLFEDINPKCPLEINANFA